MSHGLSSRMVPVLLAQRSSLNDGLESLGLVIGSSYEVRIVCGASCGIHPIDRVPTLTLHHCCGSFELQRRLSGPQSPDADCSFPRKPGHSFPELPRVEGDSLYELECLVAVQAAVVTFSAVRQVRCRPVKVHSHSSWSRELLESILGGAGVSSCEELFEHPVTRVLYRGQGECPPQPAELSP